MTESADSNPLSQGNETSNYVLLSSSEKCYSKYVVDSLNNSYKKKLDSLNEQHTIDSIVYNFKIDSLQLQQKINLLENQNHEMSDMWDTIISQGKKIENYEKTISEFANAKPENANLVNHVQEINKLRGDSSTLESQITDLKEQLRKIEESQGKKNVEHSGKENNPIISSENVPYVCGLLIVLIIAITIISLKRGLTFSKGNTSICIGEKKKTRTKKAD
ncbi:MAG: hypothetical protein II892_14080 [Fibrobacter sp.]|nr:hypothetical protein [Fibrobacter sp.]